MYVIRCDCPARPPSSWLIASDVDDPWERCASSASSAILPPRPHSMPAAKEQIKRERGFIATWAVAELHNISACLLAGHLRLGQASEFLQSAEDCARTPLLWRLQSSQQLVATGTPQQIDPVRIEHGLDCIAKLTIKLQSVCQDDDHREKITALLVSRV